jgi:hypothetical protein
MPGPGESVDHAPLLKEQMGEDDSKFIEIKSPLVSFSFDLKLSHNTREQSHPNLEKASQYINLASTGHSTHKQAITHLAEINRTSRIKVNFRVDF